MTDVADLRERIVGQRFYDTEAGEAFVVVGITPAPPLALLQYDDGIAWDEGASGFTVGETTAQMSGLDEDGLDSERYIPLGAGPRVENICKSEKHDWFPAPDSIWPDGISEEHREALPSLPLDFYSQIVRCRRCGLSGDVAQQFGVYGGGGHQQVPWFCYNCETVVSGDDLEHHNDVFYCPDCSPE